jgi:hypothetical protein
MPAGQAAEDRRGAAVRRRGSHRTNWDSHRVPERNFNIPQSLASLDRMAVVLKESNAQLWIGHETSEVPLRKYLPAHYE